MGNKGSPAVLTGMRIDGGQFSSWIKTTKKDWWGKGKVQFKLPPNYIPSPPQHIVDLFVLLQKAYDSHEMEHTTVLFPWRTMEEWADYAEYLVLSTQNAKPGIYDGLFGRKSQSPADLMDAVVHLVGVLTYMSLDYRAYNRILNRPDNATYEKDWTFAPPEKDVRERMPWVDFRGRQGEKERVAKEGIATPALSSYQPPGHIMLTVMNFYVRSLEYDDRKGLFKRDLVEDSDYLMNAGQRATIINWLTKTFPDHTQLWQQAVPNGNTNLPYHTWYGQFAYQIGFSVSAAKAWDPIHGFKNWPPRDYSNAIFDLECSLEHSDSYRTWVEFLRKNPKAGYSPMDILDYPCPLPDMVDWIEKVSAAFPISPSVEFPTRFIWNKIRAADIPMVLSAFSVHGQQGGFIPDDSIWYGGKKVGSAYQLVYQNYESNVMDPTIQAALSFLLYKLVEHCRLIHQRIAGREYAKWQWDERGAYVNPTPQESYQDCLRGVRKGFKDENGNLHICDPSLTPGWDKPWDIVSDDEIRNFIMLTNPKLPIRDKHDGEIGDEYEQKKLMYNRGYANWVNTVMQGRGGLKEFPIGAVQTLMVGKKAVTVINTYFTYGMTKSVDSTPWSIALEKLFNPYWGVYGKKMLQELMDIAEQFLELIKTVLIAGLDLAEDAAGRLLKLLEGAFASLGIYMALGFAGVVTLLLIDKSK